MAIDRNTYKTIARPSPQILYKVKKSKFFGYAFPIRSEDDVKPIIQDLRRKHHTANHVCYAWQLGADSTMYRANDDGEPNNSAGMPIYGQIQSFELTNVLVAVARIFGGTKLGVGGLISAYREAAKIAVENSKIVQKTIVCKLQVKFAYADINKVMHIIKQQNLIIVSQKMEMDCEIILEIPRNEVEIVLKHFLGSRKVKVKQLE